MTDQTPPPTAAAATPGLEAATLAYLHHLGRALVAADLWVGLPQGDGDGLPMALLPRAIARFGLQLRHLKGQRVAQIVPPCLLVQKGGGVVFVHSVDAKGDQFAVQDPAKDSAPQPISRMDLAAISAGEVVYFIPETEALTEKHAGTRARRHWFWGHFGVIKARIFDVVLASAFANILAITVSLFALQVYDRVVPNQNEATLWVLASGAAAAIVMEFFLRVSRAMLIDRAGRDIEIAVNRDLFQRLIDMRLDRRPMPPGALVNTMREFSSVKEFFAVSAVGVVTDLPFVLVFLLVIFAISGPLVAIVALGAVLMVCLGLVFQARMRRLSKDMLGANTAALRILTEASYGMEMLRSHNAAHWFQRNWEEVAVLNALKSSEHRRLSATLSFAAGALQMLTYISVVTGGVYMFFGGLLSVGGIIAVSILTSRTLAPVVQLSSIISRWQNTKASLEALEGIATAAVERPAERSFIRRTTIQGHLMLRDIRTAYPGVEGVQLVLPQLEIKPGRHVALLGENGSGKSLLLRILAGLYEPLQGTYVIDGVEARQIDPDDRRRAIAFLPQDPRLFKGTLRENLSVGSAHFSDAQLIEALEFAGLGRVVSTTTLGLDLPIHDGGEGLSVGQRAAVGLARLYLQDPALVILDEPTAAMDTRAETAFVKRFATWLQGRGCIIATHRLALMDVVDEVVVLAEGRLLAAGPKDEVLARFTAPATAAKPSEARA